MAAQSTPRDLDSLQGGELFRHYLGKYKWKYARGLGSLVVVDVLDLLIPLLTAAAIDALTAYFSAGASRVEVRRTLFWCALGYLVAHILMGTFRYVWRMAFIGTSFRIDQDLKTTFFSRLLKLSPGFYGKNPTGDLMSRATNDHEAVRMALGMGTLISLDAVFYLLLVPPLMLYLSWKLTLLVLIPMPLIPILIARMGRIIEERMGKVQEGFSDLSRIVQEAFSGIRAVKGYVRETAEEGKFETSSRRYVGANLHLARAQILLEPLMQYSVNVGFVILLVAGGGQVLEGAITVGSWVALHRYVSRLSWPMVAIGWTITLTRRGRASAKRILGVVNETPDVADADDPGKKPALASGRLLPTPEETRFDERAYPPLAGEIEARNLSFSYSPGGPKVLDRVSFRVRPGETVALVGRIGSGKSTLVHLLSHLYPVARGELFIDGRDVNDIPLKQLRESLGFVPQEPFLFSETIGRNVAMGRPGSNLSGLNGDEGVHLGGEAPAWVKAAAQAARLADEIERIPGRYDALLGERGINLSGGQKQRLTLARALVREPSIVVFDDTLSAVDARTEEEILEKLLSYARKRTAILITHRFTAARRADRVLVLDNGHLVGEGRHEELLARGGLYAELYEKQQLEAALEAEEAAEMEMREAAR